MYTVITYPILYVIANITYNISYVLGASNPQILNFL